MLPDMVGVGWVDINVVLVQCDKWSKLDKWLFLLGDEVGDVPFDLVLPPYFHIGNHYLSRAAVTIEGGLFCRLM